VQEVLLEAEEEGTEWIECDNVSDLTSSIDSTYFDKLTVLVFSWSICMGFIQSLLDFGYTTCVRPPWDMIAIPLFWQSTIFWDTLAYFVSTPCSPNTPSRRVKRSVARHKRRKNCNMPYFFFRKHGVDGAGRKYLDTNSRDKAAQRSINTHTATRRSRRLVALHLHAISIA
jgi:hypothetical protein